MLSGSDVERNVLNHVDFIYYSISSFKSGVGNKQLSFVPDSFSALHSNVRSVSANYGKLSALLSNLNFKFSVIGLTETKISMQKCLASNVSIDGYNFFYFYIYIYIYIYFIF